jgi:hypothetical protein
MEQNGRLMPHMWAVVDGKSLHVLGEHLLGHLLISGFSHSRPRGSGSTVLSLGDVWVVFLCALRGERK